MITLTKEAEDAIKDFFEKNDKPLQPIRLFMAGG
jgi:hypothetical protein